jgi:hypothetical protein
MQEKEENLVCVVPASWTPPVCCMSLRGRLEYDFHLLKHRGQISPPRLIEACDNIQHINRTSEGGYLALLRFACVAFCPAEEAPTAGI